MTLADALLPIGVTAVCCPARSRTAEKASAAARQMLAEMHMRADGIDPTKPYITDVGSPPWLARTQAAVVVGPAAHADMREGYEAWNARRLPSMEVLPRNDRGQIIEPLRSGVGDRLASANDRDGRFVRALPWPLISLSLAGFVRDSAAGRNLMVRVHS